VSDEMDDILARLQLLEDERAILRTLYRYGHSIDAGQEADWVDCFTEDGRFFAHGRHTTHTALDVTGRPALQALIAEHTRRPYLYHQHGLIEPLISVDGDHATCVSYLTVLMEHEGRPVQRVFGRYLDQLVRGSDGRWRFRVREAAIDSQAPGLPPFVNGMARLREG
jgi:ketosteroid isomerase-like protein